MVGIASLVPPESWFHPPGAYPTKVEQMMGEMILWVMATSPWRRRERGLQSIESRSEPGV